MSRSKELIKNTGILMIAKISTQFVSFLLLPLYTALLTTEEYGEIDIYTSLAMIIIPFLTLQLEMGLFRFFITEKSNKCKSQIITTSFACILSVLLIVSSIFGVISYILKITNAAYIYWYYVSMTISTVMLQVCRAYGDNKTYGIASFIGSSLSICLNVLFIAVFHWKVEGILLSSILSQLVCSIYMIIRTRVYKYLNLRLYNKRTRKMLLHYSVPLVFNQISSWSINYSDRVIILAAFGTGANGIYSLANKFSNITNTFFNVFNVAWTENVVRGLESKDNEDYINKLFLLVFNIYFALITGIINLLPLLFSMLVNVEYLDAYGHVPILLLGIFFSGMAATIGSVYIAYGKTKEVSITTIIAGICNVLVHLLLLHSFGLYAASISTLVSFGLLFIYRYLSVNKFFKITISVKKLIPQMIIYVIAWISYLIRNNVFVIIGLTINVAFIIRLIIKNKDRMLCAVNSFRNETGKRED